MSNAQARGPTCEHEDTNDKCEMLRPLFFPRAELPSKTSAIGSENGGPYPIADQQLYDMLVGIFILGLATLSAWKNAS
jgi:hypothetical protein